MPTSQNLEALLKAGATEWNRLRSNGKVPRDHTGATINQLFSANADLSGLELVGSEWEKCDLSKLNFREANLANSYFHGGRLQDCDFRAANLEGATFEKLRLVRCDFTGAEGLQSLDLDEVVLDRVIGLEPEEPVPDQDGSQGEGSGVMLPTGDSPSVLLSRVLQKLATVPIWVLDTPSLHTPLPENLSPGSSLESKMREAVKARLGGERKAADAEVVKRAQQALRFGSKEAAVATLYLREVGVDPRFRFSAAGVLRETLRRELDVDDLTATVDPRVTGSLLALNLTQDVTDFVGEVRRRLAAVRLFTAAVEAGVSSSSELGPVIVTQESSKDLAAIAAGDVAGILEDAFGAFVALPDEVRARRLAYLAEAAGHLDQLSRLPPDLEPKWLQGPEWRECHDQEMQLIQTLRAEEIPLKVAALARDELGVPEGTVPEESETDLYIHYRCRNCDKEKLVVQSPDA